jgi:putative oxidoreductase
MFGSPSDRTFRNSHTDWVLRGGIALVFILIGLDKIPSGPDAPWVVFYKQAGIGQWYRYFTGTAEVIGGLLVLFPRTVNAGLMILIAVMVGAALTVSALVHRPLDAFVPIACLCAIAAFWLHRRRT